MKKYIKPQIAVEELEVSDIITASSVFTGLADLDKSGSTTFDDSILDPKSEF